MEMKVAINSFQTKDMDELLKFQRHVEENLEELTDETQVSIVSGLILFIMFLLLAPPI